MALERVSSPVLTERYYGNCDRPNVDLHLDSLAAYYQSRQHGGFVPAGSWFSSSQSYGTVPPRVFVVEVEPEGESAWLSLMRCVWFGCFLYLWYV